MMLLEMVGHKLPPNFFKMQSQKAVNSSCIPKTGIWCIGQKEGHQPKNNNALCMDLPLKANPDLCHFLHSLDRKVTIDLA